MQTVLSRLPVTARYEVIAHTTKVQIRTGDCFVPRNDDRCSDITLQGIDGKGIPPRHFSLFEFFIGTANDGSSNQTGVNTHEDAVVTRRNADNSCIEKRHQTPKSPAETALY
jgi:hypothetical protein